MLEEEKEEVKEEKRRPICMLRAYSSYRLAWDILISTMATIDAVTTPLLDAFEQLHWVLETNWFHNITYIIDVIYICDFLRSFRTTYYNK